MGKEQSKLNPSVTPSTPSSKALENAISPKQLAEVQKTILLEYPFLENVYESMLLTDCRLPDCPIVFANDQFERMTLYPKEEIIGRNCRFLQGPHSNPNTVKAIRAAVDNGQPLDVEILNYRKDGVPFMNCFLMLPIHKNANPKKMVTHFLAIQKDVTLLRPWECNPRDWSPSEVSMWLDKWGFTTEAKLLLTANVDGKILLTKVNDAFLLNAGVSKMKSRRAILEHIAQVKADSSLAYAGKSIEGSTYKAPSTDATAVDLSGARVWWNIKKKPVVRPATRSTSSSSSSSSNANTDDEVDINSDASGDDGTEDERFSKMASQSDTIAIKVYFSTSSTSSVFMELVPISMKMKKLRNLISERVRGKCRLSFYDPDGELQSLRSQDDWETAVMLAENQILRIQAKVRVHKLSKSDAAMLETLGTAVLVMDGSFSDVLYCNSIAKRTFGSSVSKKNSSFLFPDLDLSSLSKCSWTPTSATHQDGHRFAVSVTVSETKGYLHIVLVAPQLTVKPLDL